MCMIVTLAINFGEGIRNKTNYIQVYSFLENTSAIRDS